MNEVAIFMTVDTEGDNLWNWIPGRKIETNNSQYVEPFQVLCERYRIPPVYLTNYEMAISNEFVNFVGDKARQGKCEIGMHLHAWNSPPEYKLNDIYGGNPYITEYNKEQIYEKHKFLMELITERFGVIPTTYRAGRWATNDDLFDVLDELGFLVDCSVTPGIYHKTPGATVKFANNYRNSCNYPYRLREALWEIPMTTDKRRSFHGDSIYRKAVNIIRGEERWLRPALHSAEEMISIVNDVLSQDVEYLMFMIHSSELMPGGSPYCHTETDVKHLLNKLEEVFNYVSLFGKGYSIKNYYDLKLRGRYERNTI